MDIQRKSKHGGVLVRPGGALDDTFDRFEFARDLRGSVVVVDLDDVREVSTAGANEWLRAIGDVRALYLCFVRCRPAVISRLNDVPGFSGGGQIVSFYLPYECPQCRNRFETLHDLRRPHAWVAALAPPGETCPQCGTPALFDGLPEVYLAYVKAAPPVDLPALAEELIDETEPAQAAAEPEPREPTSPEKAQSPDGESAKSPATGAEKGDDEANRKAQEKPSVSAPDRGADKPTATAKPKTSPPGERKASTPAAPAPAEKSEAMPIDSGMFVAVEPAPPKPAPAKTAPPKPARTSRPPPPPRGVPAAPPPAVPHAARGSVVRRSWFAVRPLSAGRSVPWYFLPVTALLFLLVGIAVTLYLSRRTIVSRAPVAAPARPRPVHVPTPRATPSKAPSSPTLPAPTPPAAPPALARPAQVPTQAAPPSATKAPPAATRTGGAPTAAATAPPTKAPAGSAIVAVAPTKAPPLAGAAVAPPEAPAGAAHPVPADAPGRLTVFSTPRGATVAVDNDPPRPTPLIRVPIPFGRHRLNFRTRDGQEGHEFIFVHPDQHVRVDWTLGRKNR